MGLGSRLHYSAAMANQAFVWMASVATITFDSKKRAFAHACQSPDK